MELVSEQGRYTGMGKTQFLKANDNGISDWDTSTDQKVPNPEIWMPQYTT